ncbi:hypothetical protein BDE36_4070 [Arcticibacter tournemirensis]|uniref:hypothetical protein n=1 Tax=Arcticibacter tournemirensis TaxID=699437 RepID=UPI0011723259|nr:hypothetical protein [Arcticibacter tournemirensis]TQM52267.1 hypothetical protein BDE36_4070 [Arcticibacter tournemirensis]
MDLNYWLIVLVLLIVIAALFFFLKRNAKDKKALGKKLNASETIPARHDENDENVT